MNNSFILEGNLVKEPETKLVGTKTVIKFTIAENNRVKDANGNWVDGEANFNDMNFWTEKPDFWLQRLGKGVPVVCRGTIKQDKWEKDGVKQSKITFTVQDINAKWLPVLNAGTTQAQTASAPSAQTASAPSASADEMSIPF